MRFERDSRPFSLATYRVNGHQQNNRPAEQERIIAALLASDLEVEREIGAYMQTLATKKKP